MEKVRIHKTKDSWISDPIHEPTLKRSLTSNHARMVMHCDLAGRCQWCQWCGAPPAPPACPVKVCHCDETMQPILPQLSVSPRNPSVSEPLHYYHPLHPLFETTTQPLFKFLALESPEKMLDILAYISNIERDMIKSIDFSRMKFGAVKESPCKHW